MGTEWKQVDQQGDCWVGTMPSQIRTAAGEMEKIGHFPDGFHISRVGGYFCSHWLSETCNYM